MNNYLAVNNMITIILITFESYFGIQNIYISKDFYYSIQQYGEVYQEQIIDLNTGIIYNKNNKLFEFYPNDISKVDQYNLRLNRGYDHVNFLDMESIEIRDTLIKGNYKGYVREYYSILPEVTNYLIDVEKCLRIPGSIYLDSIVYYKTGILESHDIEFSANKTINIRVLKSVEKIQVNSKFFVDKLLTK